MLLLRFILSVYQLLRLWPCLRHGWTCYTLRMKKIVSTVTSVSLWKILLAFQVMLLLWRHQQKLTGAEKRRLVFLADPRHRRTQADQAEWRLLIAKTEPKLFTGSLIQKIVPFRIPLPKSWKQQPES